jgi:DNA-binding response OmpR family regulator
MLSTLRRVYGGSGISASRRFDLLVGFDFRCFLGSLGRMTSAVLLIDDNAVQAATRQTILKRAGYFVIAALNPRRALEQFQSEEFPEKIGLVITDHIMPEMNGAEFVRRLRVTHPTLPVLVISGLEEAEEEYAGLNVLFRLKPLLPDNLLACVHGLVDAESATELR